MQFRQIVSGQFHIIDQNQRIDLASAKSGNTTNKKLSLIVARFAAGLIRNHSRDTSGKGSSEIARRHTQLFGINALDRRNDAFLFLRTKSNNGNLLQRFGAGYHHHINNGRFIAHFPFGSYIADKTKFQFAAFRHVGDRIIARFVGYYSRRGTLNKNGYTLERNSIGIKNFSIYCQCLRLRDGKRQ